MAKKAKKKQSDEIYFELIGEVNFVEKVKGKVTKTPIDGLMVLKLLNEAVISGLKLLEEDEVRKRE
jgi:hypothetical protein